MRRPEAFTGSLLAAPAPRWLACSRMLFEEGIAVTVMLFVLGPNIVPLLPLMPALVILIGL